MTARHDRLRRNPLAVIRSRLSTYLYLRPRLLLLLLLLPPLLWLGVIYLGSLFALLAQSFFHIDDFTGHVVYEPTLGNYGDLFAPVNLAIISRTVAMATHRHADLRRHRLSARLLHGALRQRQDQGACSTSRSCCRCGRTIWCGSIPGS